MYWQLALTIALEKTKYHLNWLNGFVESLTDIKNSYFSTFKNFTWPSKKSLSKTNWQSWYRKTCLHKLDTLKCTNNFLKIIESSIFVQLIKNPNYFLWIIVSIRVCRSLYIKLVYSHLFIWETVNAAWSEWNSWSSFTWRFQIFQHTIS